MLMPQPAPTSGISSTRAKVPIVHTGAPSPDALQDGNESNVRDLFDAVPQNIYLVSAEGALLYVNRVALDYCGLPLERVAVQRVFEIAQLARRAAHLQHSGVGTADRKCLPNRTRGIRGV